MLEYKPNNIRICVLRVIYKEGIAIGEGSCKNIGKADKNISHIKSVND